LRARRIPRPLLFPGDEVFNLGELHRQGVKRDSVVLDLEIQIPIIRPQFNVDVPLPFRVCIEDDIGAHLDEGELYLKISSSEKF